MCVFNNCGVLIRQGTARNGCTFLWTPTTSIAHPRERKRETREASIAASDPCLPPKLVAHKHTMYITRNPRKEDAESPWEKVQVLGILRILRAGGVFSSRVISDEYRN